MSDLVKRLRRDDISFPETCGFCGEAADRIEALEAGLREVLEKLKASNASAWTIFDIRNIINAALAPEQDK